MSDNNQTELQTEPATIDILIENLPEQFPAAEDIIKTDIVPYLLECNPGVRDHYIKVIKKRTHAASIKSVSLLIDEAIQEIDDSTTGNNEDTDDKAVIDPEIIEAAEQIAQDPMLFKKKIDIVNQLGVINERKNIGLYQLVIDSRLLPMGSAGSDALAMKNSGHYGAGKSYPLFTTLKLYPKSAYHLISSGSEKSLYSIEGGLKYKALILAEALALESHGNRDNELAYGIRTLVSEGSLKYQYTGFIDKKRVTIVKKIDGPTSLLTTTIKGKLEDQLDDRMITSHPNTSAMQTKDIIEQTAQAASGNSIAVDERIIRAYQHYHDSLISAGVVIPYAGGIASFVSRNGSLPISARRSFKRVLSGIKTITLLHQKQRSRDEQGRFLADILDYAIVYQLLEESFAESLGNVKRYTDDRIQLIEKEGMMTPRDLSEKSGVSTAAISQWSKPLIEKGVLTWCDETGAVFGDDLALEKAKRSGKAFLCVLGGKSLPSPFQLTGDPRWDKGGDFYAAYDLELDDGGGDSDQALAVTENIISESVQRCDNDDNQAGVKVLSGKTNDDIKKMMESFRENQVSDEHDHEVGNQMYCDFSEMLSIEGGSALN
ncbi:hypothetical protein N9934_04885 [Desulfosarcina sp.]|nr:hypothetical protein [Desulfosarcina sp.]